MFHHTSPCPSIVPFSPIKILGKCTRKGDFRFHPKFIFSKNIKDLIPTCDDHISKYISMDETDIPSSRELPPSSIRW